jgi:hypothetical protein
VLVLQLASSSLPLTINYILLADCAASAWLGQVSPAICHTTALNYLTGGRLAGSGPKDQFVTISHYKAFRCRSRQSGSGKKRASQTDLRPSFDTCCGESCPLPCLKPASNQDRQLGQPDLFLSILLGQIEPTWTLKLLPSLSFPREQKDGEPPTATDDSLVRDRDMKIPRCRHRRFFNVWASDGFYHALV